MVESPISEPPTTKRSPLVIAAFALTFLGGLAATIVFALSLTYQLTILFPTLISTGSGHLIQFYYWLDIATIVGGILMYVSSVIILFQRWWPMGTILAFIGAIISVSIVSILFGVIGGVIALCIRSKPKVV